MLYLSGVHALNIPCALDTCGDWHQSALQWQDLRLLESKDSIYEDYGIEQNKRIPEHTELYNVANHIRALLDLLVQGNFAVTQGMRDEFICNDNYTEEIFDKVRLLADMTHWNEIDSFMEKEYLTQWLNFKERGEVFVNRLTAFDVVKFSNDDNKELYYGQFLDDFYHADNKAALIADEPPHSSIEPWFICFIAGAVHKLANDYDLTVPSWVFKEKYIYPGMYYAFDTKNPEFQNYLKENTPAEYRKRNIMVGNNALERC